MFRWLPEQASDFAHKVDYANYVVTDLSVFFTVVICGAMLYFAVRYRRIGPVDHDTPRIEGNNLLEVLWTVIPTVIVIWVGWLGYDSFVDMREVPPGAMEVNVTGKKWAWDFQYNTGKRTTGELIVPVDEPVKLVMTSQDVLHSFFIPVMRTKMDVVPGRYTYIWFRPIKTGDFQVFCTEYCGDRHSGMLARLKVLPRAEYDRWVNDFSEEAKLASMKPSDRGRKLYESKQCNTCHSLDGSPRVGPTWLKLWNKKEKLADGREVLVDENYLKDAILNPGKEIVAGYQNQMPPYEGQLSADDVTGLIEFIKTVQEPIKVETKQVDTSNMSPAERGKVLYQAPDNMCAGCHSIDGSQLACPTFKGVYGAEREMSDGSKVKADDAYIKESIRYPHKKLVKGFGPTMPPLFENKFTDEQLNDIIEYIKTLK